VERIWLPFMPWLTLAAIGVARPPSRTASAWLAAQAGVALALQLVVAWPW
jgi:hypothetical protein